MSLKKEQILKVNQNGVTYDVFPETKLHLVKDSNGVSLDKLMDIITEQVEGSNISTNSLAGELQNIEILGNTIQNSNNLADIKSVGNAREDGLYEIPILCTGKNLTKSNIIKGMIAQDNGELVESNDYYSNISYDYVKPSTQLTISANTIIDKMFYYDKNKKFISTLTVERTNKTVSTPNNCFYVRYRFLAKDKPNWVQLEYGTQATSFEPYQEHKITILSPVQLEKVGDIADRIIEKDGVWGVEKNITHYTLNGSNCVINKSEANAYTNVVRFWISNSANPNMNIKENQSVICDRFKSYGNSLTVDGEGVANTNGIDVHILKSKLASEDVTGFNKYLGENNTTLIYQANAPRFIPLPDNQQIKLQAFANQTNISFLTEIEGTIKADVPKSLGASVNSNTQAIQDLNKDLEKVKKLEKATTVRVSTDKGIVTCKDTVKGRINDAKLEGRTLVNLFNYTQGYKESTKIFYRGDVNKNKVFKGINVTLFNPTGKKVIVDIYSSNTDKWKRSIIMGISDKSKYVALTDDEYVGYIYGQIVDGWVNSDEDLLKLKSCCVVVEGDKASLDLPYFEGMKSVGDDINEITISSCNSGKFIIGNIENDKFIDYKTGNIEFTSSWGASDFIEVQEGVQITQFITYSSPAAGIAFYDFNKKYISGVNANKTLGDFKAIIPKGTRYIRCCDKKDEINIYFGNKTELNNICKLDKKKLLYYDTETQTWNKPILREWDSIEESLDNKYYYHKKGSEIILNGNENLQLYTQSLDKYICCFLDISNCKPKSDLICAKLSNIPTIYLESFDQEGIGIHPTLKRFYMKVLKSNLPSPDIDGVKKWLHNNPIPVVYPLEQEVVYECTSLNVDIWGGDSILQIDSIIPPKEFSFNISNNIGNIVKDIQDDVKGLKNWKDKIENATTTLVTTENNIVTVEETSNGYFEDIKLEGKTLVNLNQNKINGYLDIAVTPQKITASGDTITYIANTTIGKEYTIVKYPSNRFVIGFAPSESFGTLLTSAINPPYNENKIEVYKIVATDIKMLVYATSENKETNVLILEGDYTQNPPNFFEGMKSVADDVNSLWLTSNNGNLFDEALLRPRLEDDGYYHFRTNGNTRCSLFYGFLDKTKKQITSLTPNTGFDLRGINLEGCYTMIGLNGDNVDDKLQFPIRDFENFNLQGYKGCEFEVINPNHIKVKNVFIQKGYDNPKYIPNKSDKKRLLYYDTENQSWKKPILRKWDTIEKHSDGKYYYHKRSIEDILNGSENPWYVDATLSKCCRFYLRDSKFKNGTTICPNFNSIENYSLDEPHIYTNAGQLWLFVPKSELETENVEGLKKWLQSNNITIVYQLAQEEVYECTPIDLITFENKTNYTISSGPIHPKATLKAQNYIGNVINTLKEKVSYLEDKLYNSNLASLTMALNNLDTQNKLDQILKSLNQK